MGEEEKHDRSVDELVEEGAEQRRAARVAVAVGDHTHAEHGAAAEHEAHGDEDVERVDEELQGSGEHDPHLQKGKNKTKQKKGVRGGGGGRGGRGG